MNGGLYAILAGLAAILLAFFSGRSSQKQKDKAKIANSEKKADIAVKVSSSTASNMEERGRIETEYEVMNRQIEEAKRGNDHLDELGRIASAQAQRAMEKGALEEVR